MAEHPPLSDLGRITALVPARSGSKGVPGKNIRLLHEKPLIAWTIEAAFQSGVATEVFVSTDSAEIAAVATASGAEVPFLRPAELATDEATTLDVVLHLLDRVGDPDWLLLLQPTSPLRSGHDIAAARNLAKNCDAVVSVAPGKSPALMRHVNADGFLSGLVDSTATRRQDMPESLLLNGAIYLVRVTTLRSERTFLPLRTRPYLMPPSRSVDIDTPDDWRIAEALMPYRDLKS
ncbi:MAG: acylneuraminate cytidylyltransferase family protein [Fimbriimonadaceae bacterium]|nr:acylneuraminate cytidylyltransferase family protein [Fimbriimonadaceae bacterium]